MELKLQILVVMSSNIISVAAVHARGLIASLDDCEAGMFTRFKEARKIEK